MQRTARRRQTILRRIEVQPLGGWPARDEGTPCIPTIVRYTDQEPAQNDYPLRIISPLRSGQCCFTHMQAIGEVQEGGRALFEYRRCSECGFTVRRFLAQHPDPLLAAELRLLLARSFVRNVGAELWAA